MEVVYASEAKGSNFAWCVVLSAQLLQGALWLFSSVRGSVYFGRGIYFKTHLVVQRHELKKFNKKSNKNYTCSFDPISFLYITFDLV
jgi:hypothetical protein